ncbi:MAG: crossover junction endodeoxyribonuclease RuvC [Oscillospiraceae bacterium]|nr:crossover junction endodeoxyribonuclease RuvC [Oscillospiraceae bacterium]
MRVLGIDPGLAIIGFAVADNSGGKPVHLRHGVIRTPAGEPLEQRLMTIHDDLSELIETFRPQEAAIERLYFNKNVTTGIPVAHARGIILFTLAKSGIPISEYSPQDVKMAVTGYGNAEKMQIIEMTKQLLSLKARPKPDDAADALALAVCHIHTSGSLLYGGKING